MRVEFNNQNHWSSLQPAGSFAVEFGTFGVGALWNVVDVFQGGVVVDRGNFV